MALFNKVVSLPKIYNICNFTISGRGWQRREGHYHQLFQMSLSNTTDKPICSRTCLEHLDRRKSRQSKLGTIRGFCKIGNLVYIYKYNLDVWTLHFLCMFFIRHLCFYALLGIYDVYISADTKNSSNHCIELSFRSVTTNESSLYIHLF